ncbi:hypothetical protein RCH23_000942 [Cryobacterium sp. CAN_C3]|nr:MULTISPECIES: hypothetical protein [unclassified Cryobacterium]MEC5153576.1 hypothetical protein [Cryobacterium sp. CAN_C3]
MAVITLIALILSRETKDLDLHRQVVAASKSAPLSPREGERFS